MAFAEEFHVAKDRAESLCQSQWGWLCIFLLRDEIWLFSHIQSLGILYLHIKWYILIILRYNNTVLVRDSVKQKLYLETDDTLYRWSSSLCRLLYWACSKGQEDPFTHNLSHFIGWSLPSHFGLYSECVSMMNKGSEDAWVELSFVSFQICM